MSPNGTPFPNDHVPAEQPHEEPEQPPVDPKKLEEWLRHHAHPGVDSLLEEKKK